MAADILTNRSPEWLREMAILETEEEQPLERAWQDFEAARSRVMSQRYAAQSVERGARDAAERGCQLVASWDGRNLTVRFVREDIPAFLKATA